MALVLDSPLALSISLEMKPLAVVAAKLKTEELELQRNRA